jgi:hypothetical protein
LLAGIAAASKVTGALLGVALGATYASRSARGHARTLAPWGGLAAGALLTLPIVLFESKAGWPLLRHRLIDSQSGAGISLRNAAALVGGQLVYLSPGVAWMCVGTIRLSWEERSDAVGALLFRALAIPASVLVALCLWSRVAEPHWIAPALLALAPAACRSPRAPKSRLVVGSVLLGAAVVAAVHAWTLIPAAVGRAPARYDPAVDITNELYGWPQVAQAVKSELGATESPGLERGDVTVVGPHWVICAQLEAALEGAVPVGCNTPIPDDFDAWWPRTQWRSADLIVWVTDRRFGPPPPMPTHAPLRERRVLIERGGRVTREFTITVLARRALT